MAVTSLWAVKGWLGQVVIYIENPDKTANPAYYQKTDMTKLQVQGLSDVIEYALQSSKTGQDEECAAIKRHFIAGINCQAETAREEMTAVKKHFNKTEGIVAFHGYQSFAPGEATPEMAHEIGIKLAERLWGGRYQVIVATHLDKANHLHNHFVLNNVSMTDGKKYYRSHKDYYKMQRESDALCREYALSCIENPQPGKSRHYGEWKAEKDGQQTWRGIVKTDVDEAIRQSMTERQFWESLSRMGYEIKRGKDIAVRPPGKERFVRLFRNFGQEYTAENIRKRILAQCRPKRVVLPPAPSFQRARVKGKRHRARRMTGLRALYFYYLYRMGVLPERRRVNPKKVYFLFREDIRFVQRISQETKLLVKNRIDTREQLAAYRKSLDNQALMLSNSRKQLRNQSRDLSEPADREEMKAKITQLTKDISEIRKEMRLCEEIVERSEIMRDKISRAAADKSKDRKEKVQYEPFRRRCRTDREDEPGRR